MRYRQHSAVCELAPDCSLDDLVCGHVYIRSRLIQHKDLVLVENGSRQTDELLLTSREDCVRVRAHRLHSFLQRPHVLSQLDVLQRSPYSLLFLLSLLPHLLPLMRLERRGRKQVVSYGTLEDKGRLRDNGDILPEFMQT